MKLFKKIYDSNTDLLKRVRGKNVTFKYLSNEDVLLVSLNKTMRYSDSIEMPDGSLVIHYNSKNNRIVGFTVPYVKEFMNSMANEPKYTVKIVPSFMKLVGQNVAISSLFSLSRGMTVSHFALN